MVVAGPATIFTTVPALVDTNILVYRFDGRFSDKQATANQLLREGIANDSLRLAHQAVIEFVAAVTRSGANRQPILPKSDALREAEELLSQFTVFYPTELVLRTAMRGSSAYGLSWFDAHMWAYAEVFGCRTLYSEDFQSGRLYGSVQVVNPFEPGR